MRRTLLPFTIWLAVFDFLAWISFFAIPVAWIVFNLTMASLPRPGNVRDDGSGLIVQRNRIVPFAAEMVSLRSSPTLMALNLPGTVGEVLVSLPTSWPESYRPRSMSLYEWRCLTIPVFCLPFWWFAGRGADGLLNGKRVHSVEMVLGTIFSISFFVVLCGLRFGESAQERAEELIWPLYGLGLWAVLFAMPPAAWWRQWRARRVAAKVAA